ncbi:MAG: hypothetical protein WC523_00025 [Patescibacteria group bacterium]
MFYALAMLSVSVMPADWDRYDTALMTTLVAESVYDVMSTRYRLKHPHEGIRADQLFVENNPLLGRNPGAARIWGSFVLANGAALVLAMILPSPVRKVFLGLTVEIETINLVHNALIPGYVSYRMAF